MPRRQRTKERRPDGGPRKNCHPDLGNPIRGSKKEIFTEAEGKSKPRRTLGMNKRGEGKLGGKGRKASEKNQRKNLIGGKGVTATTALKKKGEKLLGVRRGFHKGGEFVAVGQQWSNRVGVVRRDK